MSPRTPPRDSLQELARLITKATPPEQTGSLWARVYAAIGNGDDEALRAIRTEFGTAEALQEALMKDTGNV